MGVVLDASSELDGEVNSKPQSYWTERHSTPKTQCNRSVTRRKRKPMTSPQSGFSRRCNSCGVTKTPQWREGPDGPRTLCNACGVRYSRERQDKTKLRKCKKARSKPTGNTSTKKRPRSLDPSHYDIAFLFSQKRTLSTPKSNKRSPVEDGFSGKEYAAALSLVSLAILGSTGGVSSSKTGPMKLDGSSRGGVETEDLEVDHCSRNQTTISSLSPELSSCRRSRRIMEANKSSSHYYGGFNIEEWVPNFVDFEEGSGCEGTGPSCVEDGVAVGVPCVWAAMSSLKDFCHHPSMKKTPHTAAHQDQSFLLQNPCPSSASNSAKSDVYTQLKSNDHH